jgi:hypothetical protein
MRSAYRYLNGFLLVFLPLLGGSGCGDDGGDPQATLDDFLPEVPAPTGEAQSVWAGEITQASSAELVEGPARSGMIGDFYLRNSRGRFVVQAPTRVIGVVPPGGNLVDAVALDANGEPVVGDHFGELSLVYQLGRTCRHDTVEVVQDGSGGGAAVLRARGVTASNDFINMRGIGLINVPLKLDPDIDDSVECATTYVLEPDAEHLGVYWTLFNPSEDAIDGPVGVLADTGGEIEAWGPTRGFERAGIEAITSAGDPAPVDYVVYQGPGVAYGLVPRHEDPATPNSTFLIAGVSVFLFNGQTLLDIVNRDTFFLELPGQGGRTYELEVVVGKDAADVEARFRDGRGEELADAGGQVSWSGGGGAAGARVGFYRDTDGDQQIGPDDVIAAYADAGPDGAFSASLPPGNYLVRAEVKDLARSETVAVTLPAGDLALTVADPVAYDFEIIDDDTGAIIPGKLTVIGRHPVLPDQRLFETYDRVGYVIAMHHAVRGTTTDVGDGADLPLLVPAGGTYRVIATRGTEWSAAGEVITPVAGEATTPLALRLRRVAEAEGYVGSEYHVHMLGSPDSPVSNERRIATMVADGVEVFAATDHDYVTDLQPTIESMGLGGLVRAIAGLEVTPFVYGHFNAWPIEPDDTTPNRGAIDWAQGMEGYAMIPAEIFAAMRSRGAELIQVNHPRTSSGLTDFMQFFDRAGLTFDYENRQITGDLASAPVPNEWLRLPETSLWDDGFNALEVWNGFDIADTNADGVREISRLDIVMRDWFNFLSFGLTITPIGSSDTHTVVADPGGMPRTYVRVPDDSSAAIASGAVLPEVLATLSGADSTPRDVVVTNGPHIQVQVAGAAAGSPIGSVVDGTAGSVTFDISVVAPEWAQVDTIEVFANATPSIDRNAPTVLQPLACFTARTGLADNDPCTLAPMGGPRPLSPELTEVSAGYSRWEAQAQLTLTPSDLVNRAGATGDDAWIVIRVRGSRAIFPVLIGGLIKDDNVDVLVSGTQGEIDAILENDGVPATAFTAPIYVDFDGGGYEPIFRPQ